MHPVPNLWTVLSQGRLPNVPRVAAVLLPHRICNILLDSEPSFGILVPPLWNGCHGKGLCTLPWKSMYQERHQPPMLGLVSVCSRRSWKHTISLQNYFQKWPPHNSQEQTAFIQQCLNESQAFVFPDGLSVLSVLLDAGSVRICMYVYMYIHLLYLGSELHCSGIPRLLAGRPSGKLSPSAAGSQHMPFFALTHHYWWTSKVVSGSVEGVWTIFLQWNKWLRRLLNRTKWWMQCLWIWGNPMIVSAGIGCGWLPTVHVSL